MRLLPALLLVALAAGCQRAERYGRPVPEPPPPAEAPKTSAAEPLNPGIQWIDIGPNPPKCDVRIEFVHAETAPKEWAALKQFWNAPALTRPAEAAALIGLSPLATGSLVGGASATIKIKVPLGLPDPSPHVPPDNLLTLGKWNLGRRLFFDDTYLADQRGVSCAGCHRPEHGFADSVPVHPDSFNTPTLINCVFNRHQFWDGRVGLLEEVVQRTLEDERAAPQPGQFRHVWGGVIRRLRLNESYVWQFNQVFGTPPGRDEARHPLSSVTQDNVARVLATYLRTLLAGNSLHDRALRARKPGQELLAEHYEAVLSDAARKELGSAKEKPKEVAAKLYRGYRLFHHLEPNRSTNCVSCHRGPTFSDHRFHNVGIGYTSIPGKEAGRFATAPIGEKDRYLIDAYKTPTLRGLPRSGPYFHDGSRNTLREVVEFYDKGAGYNRYLDPALRASNGDPGLLGLEPAEIDALVLFLSALNGDAVDDQVRKPPTLPAK